MVLDQWRRRGVASMDAVPVTSTATNLENVSTQSLQDVIIETIAGTKRTRMTFYVKNPARRCK